MEMSKDATESQRKSYSWKPRRVSPWAVMPILLSMISAGVAVLLLVDEQLELQDGFTSFGWANWVPFAPVVWIALSAILAAIGIATELISRFRVPPATWRVKVELQQALIDLGLLDGEDTRRWRGIFWCAPFGKYRRREKLYTLLFDCRTVKATPQVFKEMEQRIAGFHKSQDAAIEPYRRKGKRACYQLMLWYGTSPYEKGLKDVAPW